MRISPNQPSSVIRVCRSQCVFHERPLGPVEAPISWRPSPLMLMSMRAPRGSPMKRTAFSLSLKVSRSTPNPSSPFHSSRVRENALTWPGSRWKKRLATYNASSSYATRTWIRRSLRPRNSGSYITSGRGSTVAQAASSEKPSSTTVPDSLCRSDMPPASGDSRVRVRSMPDPSPMFWASSPPAGERTETQETTARTVRADIPRFMMARKRH
jgi:hypothetical protein